jgi:hypothetical protein
MTSLKPSVPGTVGTKQTLCLLFLPLNEPLEKVKFTKSQSNFSEWEYLEPPH